MLAVMRRGRLVRIGLGVVVVLAALLLGVGQLLLPKIAAKVVRDKLGRYGQVRDVSVEAVPALQLLWGEAGLVQASARSLTLSPGQLILLLREAHSVDRVSVKASSVTLHRLRFGGPATFAEASIEKHGQSIDGKALLTANELAKALPPGVEVKLLSSSKGRVEVRASGSLLGFQASVDAIVEAVDGRLQLSPVGALLSGLATLTLFEDPRLRILAVAAKPVPGAWALDLKARLQ